VLGGRFQSGVSTLLVQRNMAEAAVYGALISLRTGRATRLLEAEESRRWCSLGRSDASGTGHPVPVGSSSSKADDHRRLRSDCWRGCETRRRGYRSGTRCRRSARGRRRLIIDESSSPVPLSVSLSRDGTMTSAGAPCLDRARKFLQLLGGLERAGRFPSAQLHGRGWAPLRPNSRT
jgi:hypothetical protein